MRESVFPVISRAIGILTLSLNAAVLLSGPQVLARDSEAPKGERWVKVHSFDGEISPSEFDGRYQKTSGRDLEIGSAPRLPHPKRQLVSFRKAGMEKEVAPMDAMDRDLLWMRAGKGDLGELRKRYPRISSEKLKALVKLVQEQGRDSQ